MSLIERVTAGWPGVPVKDRRQHYQGVIKHLFSDEELALKRMHGRAIQLGLFRAKQYEAEAIATAQQVNPEYEA